MSAQQGHGTGVHAGIDIGGTGVKGNLVNVETGEVVADRVRIETPHPATPDAVADTVAEVVGRLDAPGRIGLTLPSVVRGGRALTAANIDPAWVGTDAVALFSERLPGHEVRVVNDADAAGLAEVRFGAARGRTGTVIVLTLGTGIGSAVFRDGLLLPNTELGHLEVDGRDAETHASANVREWEHLSWSDWAERLNRYLSVVEGLVNPDLFVLGGGISKKAHKWRHHVDVRTEVVTAALLNEAGIVGAAMAAVEDTSP